MNVLMFSNECPKCKVLKMKLDTAGINYYVSENFDELIQNGFENLPVLKVGDEYLDFSKAIKWINSGGKE